MGNETDRTVLVSGHGSPTTTTCVGEDTEFQRIDVSHSPGPNDVEKYVDVSEVQLPFDHNLLSVLFEGDEDARTSSASLDRTDNTELQDQNSIRSEIDPTNDHSPPGAVGGFNMQHLTSDIETPYLNNSYYSPLVSTQGRGNIQHVSNDTAVTFRDDEAERGMLASAHSEQPGATINNPGERMRDFPMGEGVSVNADPAPESLLNAMLDEVIPASPCVDFAHWNNDVAAAAPPPGGEGEGVGANDPPLPRPAADSCRADGTLSPNVLNSNGSAKRSAPIDTGGKQGQPNQKKQNKNTQRKYEDASWRSANFKAIVKSVLTGHGPHPSTLILPCKFDPTKVTLHLPLDNYCIRISETELSILEATAPLFYAPCRGLLSILWAEQFSIDTLVAEQRNLWERVFHALEGKDIFVHRTNCSRHSKHPSVCNGADLMDYLNSDRSCCHELKGEFCVCTRDVCTFRSDAKKSNASYKQESHGKCACYADNADMIIYLMTNSADRFYHFFTKHGSCYKFNNKDAKLCLACTMHSVALVGRPAQEYEMNPVTNVPGSLKPVLWKRRVTNPFNLVSGKSHTRIFKQKLEESRSAMAGTVFPSASVPESWRYVQEGLINILSDPVPDLPVPREQNDKTELSYSYQPLDGDNRSLRDLFECIHAVPTGQQEASLPSASFTDNAITMLGMAGSVVRTLRSESEPRPRYLGRKEQTALLLVLLDSAMYEASHPNTKSRIDAGPWQPRAEMTAEDLNEVCWFKADLITSIGVLTDGNNCSNKAPSAEAASRLLVHRPWFTDIWPIRYLALGRRTLRDWTLEIAMGKILNLELRKY